MAQLLLRLPLETSNLINGFGMCGASLPWHPASASASLCGVQVEALGAGFFPWLAAREDPKGLMGFASQDLKKLNKEQKLS